MKQSLSSHSQTPPSSFFPRGAMPGSSSGLPALPLSVKTPPGAECPVSHTCALCHSVHMLPAHNSSFSFGTGCIYWHHSLLPNLVNAHICTFMNQVRIICMFSIEKGLLLSSGFGNKNDLVLHVCSVMRVHSKSWTIHMSGQLWH